MSCEGLNPKSPVVGEELCQWRYNTCGPACPITCQHPDPLHCSLTCVEGCHAYCPPGEHLLYIQQLITFIYKHTNREGEFNFSLVFLRPTTGWGCHALCRSLWVSGVYPWGWENLPWQQGHPEPRWPWPLQDMVILRHTLDILDLLLVLFNVIFCKCEDTLFFSSEVTVTTTPWAVRFVPPSPCPPLPHHTTPMPPSRPCPSLLWCPRAHVTAPWIWRSCWMVRKPWAKTNFRQPKSLF